jgi:hypothetical protein
MYTTLQNTPLQINLLTAVRSTGWTMVNNKAIHETCNAGYLTLRDLNLEVGVTYEFSVNIESISGGYLQAFLGDDASPQFTTTGYKFASTTVSAGDTFRFYSTANCVISEFTARRASQPLDQKATNTIVFNEKSNKWVSYYTFVPDCATSLFTNMYSFKNGTAYNHIHQSESRNQFYGTNYDSIIQFVDAGQPQIVKSFQSLSIQCNQLMITTEEGIETSLGQISELSTADFIKDTLNDGVSKVSIFTKEGVYSSCFLRDINAGGLLNGDVLKGNYIIIELQSTEDTLLKLFTVAVVSKRSAIGAR